MLFLSSAKPGGVVGPVLPYENGRNLKDNLTRNAILPKSVSPDYISRTNAISEEKTTKEALKESSRDKKQQQQQPAPQTQSNVGTKPGPMVGMDININPYQPQPKAGQLNQRIAIDLKLLQAQSQFGSIGTPAVAVPASHPIR